MQNNLIHLPNKYLRKMHKIHLSRFQYRIKGGYISISWTYMTRWHSNAILKTSICLLIWILWFNVLVSDNAKWHLTLSAVTIYSISTRFTSSTPLTALISSMMEKNHQHIENERSVTPTVILSPNKESYHSTGNMIFSLHYDNPETYICIFKEFTQVYKS